MEMNQSQVVRNSDFNPLAELDISNNALIFINSEEIITPVSWIVWSGL
jgi:hypothetical protein